MVFDTGSVQDGVSEVIGTVSGEVLRMSVTQANEFTATMGWAPAQPPKPAYAG
jgi:hypothetical protein